MTTSRLFRDTRRMWITCPPGILRIDGVDVWVLADNEAEARAAFAVAAPGGTIGIASICLTTIRRDHPEAGRYRDVTPHLGQWRVTVSLRGKRYVEPVTGYSLETALAPLRRRKRLRIDAIECLRMPAPKEG